MRRQTIRQWWRQQLVMALKWVLKERALALLLNNSGEINTDEAMSAMGFGRPRAERDVN